MKEWYLNTSTPNICSGYESDEIDEYGVSNFSDVMYTNFSDPIIKCNHDKTVNVTINVIIQGVVEDNVISTTKRQLLCVIGTFKCGDYVYFENSYWLVVVKPSNNKAYEKVIVQLCSYTIKFQSPTGAILSYPCIDEESTVTIDETKVINTSGTKHSVKLPFDAYTKMIAEDKRFIMDVEGKAKPATWIVEGYNNTQFNYGDNGGLVILNVRRNEFNPTTDNAELMIANYQGSVTPTTTTNTYAKISVNGSLYTNSIRTFTATFYNADNTVNSGITAVWNFTYPSGYTGFKENNVDSKSVELTVPDNDDLIGQNVVVNVSDDNGGYVGSLTKSIS